MTKAETFKLYDHLRFLGFSPEFILREDLANLISEYWPTFDLFTTDNFDDLTELQVRLYFCKSSQKDAYFLQKYQVTLRYRADPTKDKSQLFHTDDGIQIKLKEAFNLLQGRAVYKEVTGKNGEKFNAWIQLNFKEKDVSGNFKMVKFRSHHGYELANVLDKYPIRELADNDLKEVIIQSLKAGDRRLVTFLKPSGKTEKKIIEANPAFKTINIYSVAKATQKDEK
jgi:hypothetical protein